VSAAGGSQAAAVSLLNSSSALSLCFSTSIFSSSRSLFSDSPRLFSLPATGVVEAGGDLRGVPAVGRDARGSRIRPLPHDQAVEFSGDAWTTAARRDYEGDRAQVSRVLTGQRHLLDLVLRRRTAHGDPAVHDRLPAPEAPPGDQPGDFQQPNERMQDHVGRAVPDSMKELTFFSLEDGQHRSRSAF
jgi:hypothetical protein